jgi:hypothetical protein
MLRLATGGYREKNFSEFPQARQLVMAAFASALWYWFVEIGFPIRRQRKKVLLFREPEIYFNPFA